jgi:hypothetical protein
MTTINMKTQKRKINKSKVKKKMNVNYNCNDTVRKKWKYCVSTSTISTQTDFDVLNMSGDSNVKRNKMTNLANKDKRAWLRAEYGKKWYEPKDKKAERVARWKAYNSLHF